MGRVQHQGAGWLFSSCHQCPHIHMPSRFASISQFSASVHADAMLCFASPPHSRRVPPMPAFSAFPPRSHSSPPLTAAAAPPTHTRGVHMYTCVQRVSLLSVVWRIPPPWDHVYIVFNRGCLWVGGVDVGVACRRGGLSNTALSTTRRSRRRRRFPVIKSHACMARGLLVRQSLAIGVFSLIGHTTSIRAVVCLRLPVAIYVLFDAPAYRRFCGCMQCIYIFYLLVCLWFYHGMLMCIIYGLIVVRFPWFHWFFITWLMLFIMVWFYWR